MSPSSSTSSQASISTVLPWAEGKSATSPATKSHGIQRQHDARLQKIYRQASSLYLTRRLQEALTTLEPVVDPKEIPNSVGAEDTQSLETIILSASRSLQIKTWTLYLTLLDAIINLGSIEGGAAIGKSKWRAIAANVREGGIWDDVVQIGYGGNESDVEPIVVTNLATLLITHAPSQFLTQRRLESYLSTQTGSPMDASAAGHPVEEKSMVSSSASVTSIRDLNARIELLELYTLRVLSANQEWDLAQSVISNSDILDYEKRDAFLEALQSSRDEVEHRPQDQPNHQGQNDFSQRDGVTESPMRDIEPTSIPPSEGPPELSNHKRLGSETDYGIESDPVGNVNLGPSKSPTRPKPATLTGSRYPPAPRPSRSKKKTVAAPGLYQRASDVMANLHDLFLALAKSLRGNPTLLLRTLLFLVGLLLALSRRDIRERVRRLTGAGWNKVKSTVGMGVKVSYI
ncbi:MAG: hypothetical protein M1825_002040 [Sarcosagium campestre]|nr:MAG: hypothetical protein M1825_002040 [Sarcosagium campestre]